MKSDSNIFGGLALERNSNQNRPQPGGFFVDNAVQAAFEGNAFDQAKLDRMYKYPASLKEAEVHKLASKFGYRHSKLRNNDKVHVCPDCQNLASTMDVPLCYGTTPDKPEEGKEVFLVATDASLYFIFVKMVILYLVLKLLVLDAFTLYSSMHGNYCTQLHLANPKHLCAYSLSGYNLNSAANQAAINTIDVLALAFTLLSIIFFLIFRKQLGKIRDWLDFSVVTQDDFAILVEDIPKFIFDEDTTKDQVKFQLKSELQNILEGKIQEWLRKVVRYKTEKECQSKVEKDFWKSIVPQFEDPDGQNLLLDDDEIVTSITLCYDLTEIENINALRTKLIDEFIAKNKKAELKQTELMSYIPNRIDVLNKEFIHLCEQFALNTSPSFTLSKFTGKAFVCFQFQHYRDYLVKEYQKNPKFLEVCGSPLKITKTNQPSDIFWYNMKISDSQRSKNVFYSYCILFMLLVISFAMLMGLQFWEIAQSKVHVGTSLTAKLFSYAITGLMSVLTNVINYILSYSIEKLADMERHKTKSDRTGQLVIKIVITQTINTSIIYSILYLMKPINPLSTYGLVNKIKSLVIISGLISVIWQIVLPTTTIANFLNARKYTADKPINLFQIQLNQTLEHPAFSYSAGYSFYIIYTYVVCWYGFMFPLGTPILVLIFIVQYWVDKYNLFRRFSNPVAFGQDLVRLINKSFEFSLFVFALGFYLWQSSVHFDTPSGIRVINILTLVIASIWSLFTVLAPPRIKSKIFGEEEVSFEHITYDHYRRTGAFLKTYFRQSPATFCLKETRIPKKNNPQSSDAPQTQDEAEDPEFVQEEHFDKYIKLKNEERYVDVYDKQLVGYFNNMGNSDYDYANDEEGFKDEVAAKIEERKKKRQSAKKP